MVTNAERLINNIIAVYKITVSYVSNFWVQIMPGPKAGCRSKSINVSNHRNLSTFCW